MIDPVELLALPDRPARPSMAFEVELRNRLGEALSVRGSAPVVGMPGEGTRSDDGEISRLRPLSWRSRRGIMAGFASATVVSGLIGLAAWVGRDQPNPEGSPPFSTERDRAAVSESTAVHASSSTSIAVPSSTLPASPAPDRGGEWTDLNVSVPALEGSTSAFGDGAILRWGGLSDRTGETRNDGVLVDMKGSVTDVPPAPLEPRYAAAGLWTGSQFVVFGGRSVGSTQQLAFTDGATFDPATGEWQLLPESGLIGGANSSIAWTGTQLVVWMSPGDDGELSEQGGQVALLDFESGRWGTLPAPPASLSDAVVFADQESVTLVGGPSMGSGSPYANERLVALEYRFDINEWSEPSEWRYGLFVEGARAARLSDGALVVATSAGDVFRVDDHEWSRIGQIDVCPGGVAVAAGADEVYLLGCSTYRLNEEGAVQRIRDYAVIESTYVGGFLTTDDGSLATLGAPASSPADDTDQRLSRYLPSP